MTNQSPTDLLKWSDFDCALELLQSHKYTVTEVSEYCGFSSLGYFSTVFKKHFGKSPTQHSIWAFVNAISIKEIL